jgi:copper homeostasis protein
MNGKITIEVCVDSMQSAIAAQEAAADRIELCANLLEGGTTPSAGLIALVRRRLSIKLHVMIRPRGGDFCYDADEIRVMQNDITMAKQLGADGVVFGMLDPDGSIDTATSRGLLELARPLKVTCHRAIDMSHNMRKSLGALIDLGVDCVLTSGGRQTAMEGCSMIRRLVREAEGRISVMAGSGIDDRNVRELISKTGVTQIHVGMSERTPGPMKYHNAKISMGTAKGREYDRFGASKEKLENLVAACRPPP